MKKLICVLSMLLCVCLCIPALAEPGVRQIEMDSVKVTKTGLLIVGNSEGYDPMTYTLTNLAGEALTTETYYRMDDRDYGLIEVEGASEDGIHDEGIIDSTGRVIVPAEYGDVFIASERWQMGMKLVSCDEADKEYTFRDMQSSKDYYYRIDTVDFFFDGQKAGTLDRDHYAGYPTAYGAYVQVGDRKKDAYVFYNSSMELSPVKNGIAEYTMEWGDNGQIYIHNGTGQQAFVPECTLTADEVKQSTLYDKKTGALIDLQGNVVAQADPIYSDLYDFENGYYRVSLHDEDFNFFYGIVNDRLETIVPAEYDGFSTYSDPLKYGYIGVKKGGMFGFVDAQGNVTVDLTYNESDVDICGAFAAVKDKEHEDLVIISAAIGELPEHYTDYHTSNGYKGSRIIALVKADGSEGVIDLDGNETIPFSTAYSVVDFTSDGRVIVTRDKENYDLYTVWTFD